MQLLNFLNKTAACRSKIIEIRGSLHVRQLAHSANLKLKEQGGYVWGSYGSHILTESCQAGYSLIKSTVTSTLTVLWVAVSSRSISFDTALCLVEED